VPAREDLTHDCHPLRRATQAGPAKYPYFINRFHVSGFAKRSRFAAGYHFGGLAGAVSGD